MHIPKHIPSTSYQYVVFPMKENLSKAIMFWIIIAFVSWTVYWNVENMLFTLGCAMFLLYSTSAFFLPSKYQLNNEGVTLQRPFHRVRTINWSSIRSVQYEKAGVFFSRYSSKHSLENFRGLYFPYKGNQAELKKQIELHFKNTSEAD